MSEHIRDWLAAYHDGELSAARREVIEAHLDVCPDCRGELEELRALSSLLQMDELESTRITLAADPAVFTHRVLESLPAQQDPFWLRALRFSWRMTPLGLFAVWVFAQAVLSVSSLLMAAMSLDPRLSSLFYAWLPIGPQSGSEGLLLRLVEQWFGPIPLLGALGPLALIEFSLLFVLSVLFAGWLASWFAYQKHLSFETN